jgi:hypothetical protein
MQPTAQIGNTSPQMAGTLDPSTASLLAQLYPQQQQQVQPTPQPQAASGGNWLEKLLPTGGGLLGGLIGSLGGPVGSIAGAALGSSLGRMGENAATGQSVLQGNDITSGLEGAAGQGIGMGVGKLAGGLLGKVTTGIGKSMQGGAEEAQLASEFPNAAVSGLEKEKLNFGNSISLADQAGIPKTAQAFSQARGVATGDNGYLNGVLDNIVRTNGPVSLQGYSQMVDDALAAHPEIPTQAASGLKTLLSKAMQQTGFGGEGTLSGNLSTDPDNALALLRQVRQLGTTYKGSEAGTPGAGIGDVYSKIYNGLKDTIYNRPEINTAIKNYVTTPDEIDSLNKLAGHPQLANHLMGIVTNAKTAGDILKPQAQFIDMGEAGDRALSYANNVRGTAQSTQAAGQGVPTAAGVLGLLHGGLPAMIPHLAGAVGATNVTDALAEKLAGGGVAKGVSKVMAPAIMGASQFLTHSPDYTPSTDANMNTGNTMQPTAMQQPGAMQSPNAQLYQSAMIGMQDPYLYSSIAPLLQAAAKPMQGAQTAQSALTGAEGAFQGAGGGQGMLGGLAAKLGGAVTGGSVKSYAQQKAQLATVLTSLGIPASAIPDITDTSSAAQAKWQTLTGIIQSMGGGGLLSTVPAS